MVENIKPKFFYGYIVVIAAFFILVIMWGTMYSFGVFLKPLSSEFSWTKAMTTGAYSTFMILHGLLYIVTGKLTDRFGPRVVMTACGFLLGLGYLLMSQVTALWQLYLFYGVIIGIGMSGGFIPVASTVARWFFTRRGLMTGIVVSGIGLGTMIMPPIANWLISSFSWQTSYLVIGIIALVVIISAAQFLKRDPTKMGQLPYGSGKVEEKDLKLEVSGFFFREAIRTRQFWMFSGACFSFGYGQQAIMVHIVTHATGTGISPPSAATILTIIGGLSIVGRVIMGGAGDRIGNKAGLVTCYILLSASLSWLLVTRELWMFYLFAAILGFGYGGQVTLMSPMAAKLFGLRAHGAILGAVTLSGTIGGAAGPLLTGHISDISGSYHEAFLVCAAISFAGLILISLITQTKQ